jgi:hypothetical protein
VGSIDGRMWREDEPMTPNTMAAISPGRMWSFTVILALGLSPLLVASARAVFVFVCDVFDCQCCCYIGRGGRRKRKNTFVVYDDTIVDLTGWNEDVDSNSGAAVNDGFALVSDDAGVILAVTGRGMVLKGGLRLNYFPLVWDRRH